MSRADRVAPVDGATELDLAVCSSANVMVTASQAAERATMARAIHDRGAGHERPFVAVSGEAAPTVDGVAQCVDRWFRQAAGGTLFIDRIGDLSAGAQDRLLSLLARQAQCRDGPSARADHRVRIIAGSNRSLRADLAVGSFSETLFYRLNLIHIDLMPPAARGEPAVKTRDIMSGLART